MKYNNKKYNNKKYNNNKYNNIKYIYKLNIVLALILTILLSGCQEQNLNQPTSNTYVTSTIKKNKFSGQEKKTTAEKKTTTEKKTSATNITTKKTDVNIDNIPAFNNFPYVELNNNVPYFKDSEMTTKPFEDYSELDSLNRCGVAYANICIDIMPTEERGPIGMVKPSGWHTIKYDNVDGKYLYNRCHLIGYQLAGENANEKNLITGTRYLNVTGMLYFENMVADYVLRTSNHVLYRVTPVFKNNNIVASGVIMEGKSVEDNGKGILFNVFVYNNQPGIEINYTNGESKLIEDNIKATTKKTTNNNIQKYILNKNSKKIHLPECSAVEKMNDSNKEEYEGNIEDLIKQGYERCKICNP